ncbi:MAG: hypothetical protein WCP21_11285 [Armatimonadota bacterium]
MSNHQTPGPWSGGLMTSYGYGARPIATAGPERAVISVTAYHGTIATVHQSSDRTDRKTYLKTAPPLDEAIANARLIASAPLLIDALRFAIERQEAVESALPDGYGTPPLTLEWLDYARDAIAKAEGN